ncbi:MAG: ATP-binding protein [Tumebacillaceae bacterium]
MKQTSVQAKVPSVKLDEWEIEAFHDGMVAFTWDLQVIAANRVIADIMPANWSQEFPCPVEQVFLSHTDEYEWLLRMIGERICYRNHVFNMSRNGKPRSLLADSYLLRGADDEAIGMVLMLKDIGNLVSLEKQVHSNEKLATVGKIAAGVAHEIRNPLTSIKGFLQMMQHELLSNGMEKEHKFTHVMLSEIERVNALVGELLLLSKPRELKMERLDLDEVLQALSPLIASEALLHDIEFEIELNSVGQLPRVYADRELIKQVMLNLIKNAIEAMVDSDRGRRMIVRIDYMVQERQIRIDVQDSGPGIPHYMMDRIFDTFFTTKEKGTGLGLPICQRLVNDIGGRIKVMSKGYGTTFSVFLPVHEE